MSGENSSSTGPLPAPPLYTLHPAEFQGHVNPGFQDHNPQAPPPKYEDVISGAYLKSNCSRCKCSSPLETAPDLRSVDLHGHYVCSRTNTTQSERSDEDDKNMKCNVGWNILLVCVIISIFVWRISLVAV